MAGGVAEETRRAKCDLLSDILDHEIEPFSIVLPGPEENDGWRNGNEKMIVLPGEA
jgi:hypothetical protein